MSCKYYQQFIVTIGMGGKKKVVSIGSFFDLLTKQMLWGCVCLVFGINVLTLTMVHAGWCLVHGNHYDKIVNLLVQHQCSLLFIFHSRRANTPLLEKHPFFSLRKPNKTPNHCSPVPISQGIIVKDVQRASTVHRLLCWVYVAESLPGKGRGVVILLWGLHCIWVLFIWKGNTICQRCMVEVESERMSSLHWTLSSLISFHFILPLPPISYLGHLIKSQISESSSLRISLNSTKKMKLSTFMAFAIATAVQIVSATNVVDELVDTVITSDADTDHGEAAPSANLRGQGFVPKLDNKETVERNEVRFFICNIHSCTVSILCHRKSYWAISSNIFVTNIISCEQFALNEEFLYGTIINVEGNFKDEVGCLDKCWAGNCCDHTTSTCFMWWCV